jgi:hypothetical protein
LLARLDKSDRAGDYRRRARRGKYSRLRWLRIELRRRRDEERNHALREQGGAARPAFYSEIGLLWSCLRELRYSTRYTALFQQPEISVFF